jgi:hypothetical protein
MMKKLGSALDLRWPTCHERIRASFSAFLRQEDQSRCVHGDRRPARRQVCRKQNYHYSLALMQQLGAA